MTASPISCLNIMVFRLNLIPDIVDTFCIQSKVDKKGAEESGLGRRNSDIL